MTFVLYGVLALIFIVIAGITFNRQVGAVAAAGIIMGLSVSIFFDPNIGMLIFKGSMFLVTLLIAARVFFGIWIR